MAITLGKDAASPPVGDGIISATYTEECETIDVSNRDNVGGSAGNPGYRAYKTGFITKMWEVECHDANGLIASLEANGGGFQVMSVSEKAAIDGPKTFTVSLKQLS